MSGNARLEAANGFGSQVATRHEGVAAALHEGLPIRVFIFAPFIALMLLMVGTTAIVALRNANDDALVLATRLQQATSANIRMRLDDYLARSPAPVGVRATMRSSLCCEVRPLTPRAELHP